LRIAIDDGSWVAMTKMLYAVSPIGLGHASRAAAIGIKLKGRGLEIEFATGGGACSFLRSYGFTVHDIVSEPVPDEANGVMRRPGVWYLKYWSGYRSTKRRMLGLIESFGPRLVVGDEEFSSVSLAAERGINHALISDELELGFAHGAFSRYIEKRVSRWYTELQHSVSHLLIPEFGTDRGNIHFVAPVVREVDKTRDQVRAALNIGPGSSLILFSASGSGIGRFLLEPVLRALRELDLPDTTLVVTGLTGASSKKTLYLGVERDNQNLVAASDLVVSTAGKSTIDEAASYGSPIIAIPIKNHTEQERNAKVLGYSHEDIDRMGSLITEHLGRRPEPRNYQGAENAASYLSSL
jgi:UDP-N-acetylglucosamine--N-acetylmuramyl-(pentapeptide) pyrophosphoryl-undecaprenol N-acetylglucosamine transferase